MAVVCVEVKGVFSWKLTMSEADETMEKASPQADESGGEPLKVQVLLHLTKSLPLQAPRRTRSRRRRRLWTS